MMFEAGKIARLMLEAKLAESARLEMAVQENLQELEYGS